ncbi:hypothetical protein [Streptomyces sp. NBC_00388]|uniref:hypothetical protein n=1 Tax=Streptomyces sp. NBC_00388 TaxID=2975735 RepID=UPI002E1A3BF4
MLLVVGDVLPYADDNALFAFVGLAARIAGFDTVRWTLVAVLFVVTLIGAGGL